MAKAKRRRPRTKKKSSQVEKDKIEAQIFDIQEASPYVRLLVYGKNGKGKTRLAASFPKTLIIDVNEEGTRSAREFTGTKVFPCRKWEDIAAIYWYLQRGDHPYESVAIDTLTALGDMALSRALKDNYERDPNKDPKSPKIQDWNKSKQFMEGIILQFRNLPMHVIFTCQEKKTGNAEEGEDVVTVPKLQTAVQGIAMGAVGIVGRLYQKEVKTKTKRGKRRTRWITCMLVGPHEEYESKDRTAGSGVLGRIAVNPTGEMIIKSWELDPGEEE